MPYRKSSVYTIYMYVALDGRGYIGKTGLQRKARAQANGAGYKHCSQFWNAIKRYGWNTFRYQVLATVSKDEPDAEQKACDLESSFIQKYQTNNIRFGFNTYTKDKPRSYKKLSEVRRNRRPMHKDGVTRQIPQADYNRYLEDGWVPGYNRSS